MLTHQAWVHCIARRRPSARGCSACAATTGSISRREQVRAMHVRSTARNPARPRSLDLAAAHVESVVLNGRPLDRAAIGPERVSLDAWRPARRLVVTAAFACSPQGEGLHASPTRGRRGVPVWTRRSSTTRAQVFACFDQPDLKAPVRLTVTAPQQWSVLGQRAPAGRARPAGGVRRDRSAGDLIGHPGRGPLPRRLQPAWRHRPRPDLRRKSLASIWTTPRRCSRSPGSLDFFHELFGIRTRSASTTRRSCRSSTPARWRTPAASPSATSSSSGRA